MGESESTGAKRAPLPETQAVSGRPGLVQSDADLSEDQALAALKQPDLATELIERIAKNGSLMRLRKIRLAVVEHPRTPRHVSLPLVRQLYTFELMQVALTPVVAADVKMAAEEALTNRLETISSGERLSLARRASGRIAGALLLDPEARVSQAALDNSHLTEALVIRALMRSEVPAHCVEAVCHHAQWSLRREIRMALLRNEKTPMAKAVEFSRGLPAPLLREILHTSRLPQNIKSYLLKDVAPRAQF